MHIQWISNEKTNHIVLSERYRDRFEISQPVVFCVGAKKQAVHVQFDHDFPEGKIGLPQVFKKKGVRIPDVPYEVYLQGNSLYLGPVVGILISKERVISPKTLDHYRIYLSQYNCIKGLVYLFSEQEINVRDKTIKGYGYNPQDDSWIKGVFPYPSVIYTRIKSRNRMIFNHLIAPKVFNPCILNKWDVWQCLIFDSLIRDHLPHTILLNDLSSLKMMLKFHNEIYLKPINGSFGKGIKKVIKTSDGYLFINPDKTKTLIQSSRKVAFLLATLKKKTTYLIQQSVALVHNEKNVDFRIVMQKDGDHNWNCTGILARYGDKGRIYTNDFRKLSLGIDALRDIFPLCDKEAAEKEKEIISICSRACNIIDRAYGDFGDVGIDVVVDANLKVWILEMNLHHQHTLATHLRDDLKLYQRIVSKPLEYAKSLAGFTKDKNYLE
jgi:hypothetical protein